MRLVVLAVVVSLLAVPVAAAIVGPLAGQRVDVIRSHTAWDGAAGSYCFSDNPVIGFAQHDLSSVLLTSRSGGMTTFTIHLDATIDPLGGLLDCPPIDLTFQSALEWPPASQYQAGSFSSECGLSGQISVQDNPESHDLELRFQNAPAACGLPITSGGLRFQVARLLATPTLACLPVVVPGCVGAGESSGWGAWQCWSPGERVFVRAVFDVFAVDRCHMEDGREHVLVTPGTGIVYLDATSDSCTLFTEIPNVIVTGGDGPTGTECPEAVGRAVFEVQWNEILP